MRPDRKVDEEFGTYLRNEFRREFLTFSIQVELE